MTIPSAEVEIISREPVLTFSSLKWSFVSFTGSLDGLPERPRLHLIFGVPTGRLGEGSFH